MQKFAKLFVVLTLTVLLVAPLTAEDKGKKKKKGKGKARVGAQLLKRLEKAELSDEQTAKVKEIVAKYADKIQEARKAISPDIRKKQAAARKEALAEGKKGKDLRAAVNAALSEEEQKQLKELTSLNRQLNRDVAAVLTPEQREKAKFRTPAKSKKKSKKNKKKDAA